MNRFDDTLNRFSTDSVNSEQPVLNQPNPLKDYFSQNFGTQTSTPSSINYSPAKQFASASYGAAKTVFPVVGAVGESIKQKSPEPYKQFLSQTVKNMAEPVVTKTPEGKLAINKKGVEAKMILAMGTIGGEDFGKVPISKENTIASQVGKTVGKETIPIPEKIPPIQQDLVKIQQSADDFVKNPYPDKVTQTNLKINTSNFNIDEAKQLAIQDEVKTLEKSISEKVGAPVSAKEISHLSANTSSILNKSVGRDQTVQWESAMLSLRQRIAESAQSGKVTDQFLKDLMTLKTQGTDIARKLQSLSIGADPIAKTPQQIIIDAVLKVNQNTDEILKYAQGVDFNDFNQATAFYRKFVAPKASEWLDLLRYNSMLSSPTTHIVNTFSNLINSGFIAPIEKTIQGGVDFVGSSFTGQARTAYAGEGLKYVQGYLSGLNEASNRFLDVVTNKRMTSNLDVRYIQPAVEGIKGKVANTLSLPLKLLEASDQFFTSLSENGAKASLAYKASKGVKVTNAELLASKEASYRLFRQDLLSEGQGKVLDAVDQFTSKLMSLRNNNNPIVSSIAKWTIPFVKTPTNILKQGIEYSPAGFSTMVGASDKTLQFTKAAIGTAVFGTAATLLNSGRLTWAEPTSETQKNIWRADGRQPYSVKFGNTWVSYQKLAPAIAFPFAMVASLDDLLKNKKVTQDTVDLVMASVAKYGQFLADQSYFKNIGDAISAFKGGESSISYFISNYPQQLVPFRALGGWLTRLVDDTQRKVDSKASFIDKQIQQLMMNIPGLSQNVPARVDKNRRPIKYQLPTTNAFSPIRVSQENPKINRELKTTTAQSTNRFDQ